jgi:hypothetical protein
MFRVFVKVLLDIIITFVILYVIEFEAIPFFQAVTRSINIDNLIKMQKLAELEQLQVAILEKIKP